MKSAEVTSEQIQKLPKWAQDHIKEIQQQRDTAVRVLNEYVDDQEPSDFYVDDGVCTGEECGPSFKRRFIQTHCISIEYAGVLLEVRTRQDAKSIDLSWGNPNAGTVPEIAMIPSSHQQARLVSKENMR